MQQELMSYLTPMLGQVTAANLIKHYCARMKKSVEDLKPADLPDLAQSMQPMLAVWLGSTGAARVSDEIAQLGSKAVPR